jgi:transcriptional regulator with XRE-family HTH domain
MTRLHDELVGERVAFIRKKRNKSRREIAGEIGISQQQLQKYEKAKNRIAVGRLYDLAKALDVRFSELAPDDIIED